MRIRWLGHACFKYGFDKVSVLVDPFITGNPVCPVKVEDVGNVDILLVTHDHSDHLGDAYKIMKMKRPVFVGIFELAQEVQRQTGGETIGMNKSGTATVKGVDITMVEAVHSSTIGDPAGFVVRRGDDSVYHAGDTGLFGDMATLHSLYHVRIACLPIGGHFTMSVREAVEAVRLIQPEIVVPMHYNTFDVIRVDPALFSREVARVSKAQVRVLKAGEEIEV